VSELGTKDETPGIASVDAVKRPTITNPDRARKIDDLQDAFRRKNQEVGGRFLVEVPLGDGSDRVVQVLRPDALKYAKTNFDPKASSAKPNKHSCNRKH
jgi:predicted xylose isomerase-like sugar epimerase